MTTYNIHFINKFSAANKTQDYAFFGDLPKLSHNPTGSPIYSNVFQATTLSRNESWRVGLTNNFYAWCGTADRKLASNAKIEVNASRLATFGRQSAPGSTFEMCNSEGRPSLKAKTTLTANADSCAIETGSDFKSDMNFVVGLGATDDEGRFKPLTTMNACCNAIVNIAPASKFYIAAHSSSVGTVVDTTIASRHAALIDFAKAAGMYGAVVTHEENGDFSVKYTTQAEFSAAVASAIAATFLTTTPASHDDPRDVELARLRQDLQQMKLLLNAALQGSSSSTTTPATNISTPVLAPPKPADIVKVTSNNNTSITSTTVDPYPGKPQTTWYKATLPFRNSPGQSRRRDIRDRLTTHMQSLGYVYEGGSMDNELVAMFSHHAGSYGAWHSAQDASLDWRAGYDSLPRHLEGCMAAAHDLKVVRVTESKGLWRARGETESRVSDYGTSVNGSNSANGINGIAAVRREPAPANRTSAKPVTNGIHQRTTSVKRPHSPAAQPVTNGSNGVKGVNGVHHNPIPCSKSHGPVAKPATNGPLTNGVTVNGAVNKGAVTNGVNGKYDYKRGPDNAMEAAKRRARAVLVAEGLEEMASGWKVSGY